ncbi:MAG: head maturation protease, ClpP-related [Armatimonadota bacterium]
MKFIKRIWNSIAGGRDEPGQNASVPFWRFVRNEAVADGEPEADLLLYGVISDEVWWGDEVTPKAFADELTALGDISHIRVRINSPGGGVFAAHAIYNLLKMHSAKITVHIDGMAASAASVVAMVGDEIIMPKNSMMMIHNPWSYASGDARDLRKMADTLDQVRETIIAAYQAKTGIDRGQLINLLNAETWMTADQAKGYGFIDTISDSVKVSACVKPGIYNINGQEMDFTRLNVWPGTLLASVDGDAPAEPPVDGDAPAEPPAEGDQAPQVPPTDDVDDQAPANEPPATEPPTNPPAEPDPVADAQNAERSRIKGIDELAAKIPGSGDLAYRAKYEEPMTPEQFAMAVLKSDTVKNSTLLDARRTAAGQATIPTGNSDLVDTASSRSVEAKSIADKMLKMRGDS